MTNLIADRETWLNAFVDHARPVFEAAGFPIPHNMRVSIGLPSEGYRSNVIGQCHFPAASADAHYEIFINPTVSEGDARIADILSHEVCHAACHAATGHTGHGAQFGTVARAIGLEGKLRSTTAGPAWFAWAAPILEELGPMDFGALSMAPRKKKATFLHKLSCPDCGWLVQATKSHVFPHSHLVCAVPDCGGILIYHHPDANGDPHDDGEGGWKD